MLRLLAAALLAVLFAPSSAWAAAEPLAWRWSTTEPVTFHLETTTNTPYGTWYLANRNLEARAVEVSVILDTTCLAKVVHPKDWQIECSLDRVRLSGMPVSSEADKLNDIFRQYREALTGRAVGFAFTKEGRIRSFELKALATDDERSSYVRERVRLLLVRTFGLLEMEPPPSGQAVGKWWKQGGSPFILALSSLEGTAGGTRLRHQITSYDGPVAVIESDGLATVTPGLAVEQGTMLIRIQLAGMARFDTSNGMLVYREYMSKADRTASSTESQPSDYYREIGTLELRKPKPTEAPAAPAPAAPAAAPAPAAPAAAPAPAAPPKN